MTGDMEAGWPGREVVVRCSTTTPTPGAAHGRRRDLPAAHVVIAAHRPAHLSRGHRTWPGATTFAESRFTLRPGTRISIRPASTSRSSAPTPSRVTTSVGWSQSAESVTVFPHAPRRVVTEVAMWPTPRQALAAPPGPAAPRRPGRGGGFADRQPSPRRASAPAMASSTPSTPSSTAPGSRSARSRDAVRRRRADHAAGLGRRHGAVLWGRRARVSQLFLHQRSRYRRAGTVHRRVRRPDGSAAAAPASKCAAAASRYSTTRSSRRTRPPFPVRPAFDLSSGARGR